MSEAEAILRNSAMCVIEDALHCAAGLAQRVATLEERLFGEEEKVEAEHERNPALGHAGRITMVRDLSEDLTHLITAAHKSLDHIEKELDL